MHVPAVGTVPVRVATCVIRLQPSKDPSFSSSESYVESRGC